eukprot:6182342-Pleurochrysis_carterae.AAC.3
MFPIVARSGRPSIIIIIIVLLDLDWAGGMAALSDLQNRRQDPAQRRIAVRLAPLLVLVTHEL